ncbi:Zinc finger CCHC-type [Arabidopsis thaliana x Arabidopsis arenosa]|uniref:Zinc finger CCHC-type n=1 Tax=Arabidopsis thaliana x Arabidopsis arenosa TaxID=1240361 RepID=A0A8T2AAE9_9BRAS|nr:Zinc finger CCHC-type [Arabidopsis thaliana x Arabidopsis arenosa]
MAINLQSPMAINLQPSQLVAVFDGQNYEFWAARMRTTLMNKDLWDVVKEGVPEVSSSKGLETPGADQIKEATNLRALKIKDTAALQIIQHAVADTIFDKILSATTAKHAWDLLEYSYQGNEKVKMVRLQSLRRDFENLKMKEGEKVKVYSDRIQAVANQMRALGEGRSDFDLVVKMLASMPKSYASLASLMEETKDLRTVTFAELIGSLEAHEKKFFPDEEEDTDGAFVARFRGLKTEDNEKGNSSQTSFRGKRWCSFCKKDNHNEDVCFFKHGRNKPEFNNNNIYRNRETRSCFNCGKQGHIFRDCRNRKSEEAQVNQEQEPEEVEEEAYQMFTARLATHESFEEDTWLIDSGCTNHMTPNENMFVRIDSTFQVPILIGNGVVLMSKGKGDVNIMTREGKRVIKNVFLVPEITKNLLSVSQMIENGYEVVFKQHSCLILDRAGKSIAEVQMVKNSFHLKMSSIKETSMVAQDKSEGSSPQKASNTNDSFLSKLSSNKQKFMESKTESHNSQGCVERNVESETKPAKYLIRKIKSEFSNPRCSISIKKKNEAAEPFHQQEKKSNSMSKGDSEESSRRKIKVVNSNDREEIGEVVSNCQKKAQVNFKRESEQSYEEEVKNHEPKFKGFNFQEAKKSSKQQKSQIQTQVEKEGGSRVSDKSQVISFGEIIFDGKDIQETKNLKFMKINKEQSKVCETINQEGDKKIEKSKEESSVMEKNPIKMESVKLSKPASYVEALKRPPPMKTEEDLRLSRFKVLNWNCRSNTKAQEGVLKSDPLIAPAKDKNHKLTIEEKKKQKSEEKKLLSEMKAKLALEALQWELWEGLVVAKLMALEMETLQWALWEELVEMVVAMLMAMEVVPLSG